MLALYLGMLDVEFEVVDSPELSEALRDVAESSCGRRVPQTSEPRPGAESQTQKKPLHGASSLLSQHSARPKGLEPLTF